MSYVWSGSLLPNNGAEAVFFLKQALVNVGWSIISSSNGTVLTGSDIITSASVLTVSGAFFIIKQPLAATSSYGGWRREFGFQRGTVNTQWKVSYSVSSSHASGATATQMPYGSDRKWCFETGFQGSFAGTVNTLFTTDGTYRLHICTDNAPPYGFYAISVPVGGGFPNCMIFDPMLTGSFNSNDPDPTIQWFEGDGGTNSGPFFFSNANSSNASNQTTSSNLTARGWLAKQTTSESYSGLQVPFYGVWNSGGGLVAANAGVGTNHVDSTDNLYPIFYIKTANAGGNSSVKGISSLFSGAWTARNTGDTLSVSSTRDFITFRHFLAIWDGSTPSI